MGSARHASNWFIIPKEMNDWKNYQDVYGPDHTVTGMVKVLPALDSPQLGNRRDILVYLPPSYGQSDRRYPVIYMHDGQNLFDEKTSYSGEWRVDETMEALHSEGIEAIVVGLPNAGERRVAEYTPFPDRHQEGGQGDRYLEFLVETVKPRIDSDFPTLAGPENTVIMGSSLGGLISLYAFFRHPEVFGKAGVISPYFDFGKNAFYEYVKAAAMVPGMLYMDMGGREASHSFLDRLLLGLYSKRYLASVRQMAALLQEKGCQPGKDFLYIEEKGAIHHETAWARRLPEAFRFLLLGS